MRLLDPSTFRWYEQDGIKLPSVTSIIRLGPVPTFIQKWQDRIGLEEYNRHIDLIMARGTAIHKVCENFYLKNNAPIPTEYSLQKFIQGFYTFQSIFGESISEPDIGFQIEKQLFCKDLGFAGTVDFICLYRGKLTLVDWKTSSSGSIGGEMSDNYKMQVVAYSYLWNELNPEHKVEQAMIVVLTDARSDGLGDIRIVEKPEFLGYWEMFVPYLLYATAIYRKETLFLKDIDKEC